MYPYFFVVDVLRTVLTLYVENEDLPLPTLEEVLICNQDTTAEEVNKLIMDTIYKMRYFCEKHCLYCVGQSFVAKSTW